MKLLSTMQKPEENTDNIRIKQLINALKIAMSAWKRCYIAYDVQVEGITHYESFGNLEYDNEWKEVNQILKEYGFANKM